MVRDAEDVLQRLELPYRVVERCAGDVGFSSAKGYDIEVWLPGQDKYREISSCSTYADFGGRRADLPYQPEGGRKAPLVPTLDGPRPAPAPTLIPGLANYQNAAGTRTLPAAPRPHPGG